MGCGYYIYLKMRWRLSVLTDIDTRLRSKNRLKATYQEFNLLNKFEKGREDKKNKKKKM